MGKESNLKGKELERAVHLVIKAGLDADPNLKGAQFEIESNKIIILSGVRYEIDLLVTTLPGSQHKASHVYECKNVKEPVGREVVVLLADKVDAVSANRGFLVARELSRDAKARLQQDPRLKFIPFTSDFMSLWNGVAVLHSLRDPLPIAVHLKERGVAAVGAPALVESAGCWCRWTTERKMVGLVSFVWQQIDEMVQKDSKERMAEYSKPGTHWSSIIRGIEFAPGEFFVGNREFESMVIPFLSFITVTRRKIRSSFEIKGEGQVFTFEPGPRDEMGRALQVNIVVRK